MKSTGSRVIGCARGVTVVSGVFGCACQVNGRAIEDGGELAINCLMLKT